MKKLSLIALTLLLACLLVFSGCGGTQASNPENTVTLYWDAFSKADFDTAANYVTSDQQEEIRSMKDEMEDEMFGEEMLQLMFGRFKMNTTGHEIDGDNATVDGVLTYPDMDYFFDSFFEVMFEMMMEEEEELSDEDYEKILFDSFKELLEDTPDLEENVTMELVMEDGEWRISDMPDFDF